VVVTRVVVDDDDDIHLTKVLTDHFLNFDYFITGQ
jgi:hypothetical protein